MVGCPVDVAISGRGRLGNVKAASGAVLTCAPSLSQKSHGAENRGLAKKWCAKSLEFQGFCAPSLSQKGHGAENRAWLRNGAQNH